MPASQSDIHLSRRWCSLNWHLQTSEIVVGCGLGGRDFQRAMVRLFGLLQATQRLIQLSQRQQSPDLALVYLDALLVGINGLPVSPARCKVSGKSTVPPRVDRGDTDRLLIGSFSFLKACHTCV